MRNGAGVPPAVERASCPCRFTAKACPERSEGMAVPQPAGCQWRRGAGRQPGFHRRATQWAPRRAARVKARFRYLSTSHLKSGGTMVVELYSTMTAGPRSRAPAASRSRS